MNDVTIGGIIDNDWYNKFTYVDTLRINPKLTLALGGTEDHLKFEWRLMPIKASYNNDSIPSEEQLKKYIIVKKNKYHFFITCSNFLFYQIITLPPVPLSSVPDFHQDTVPLARRANAVPSSHSISI